MKISKLKIASLMAVTIIGLGIIVFMWLENYSFVDALYMSVITLTTVGFGEVNPLSEAGRLFTTIYILIGFSGLAFVSHALIESLLETVWAGGSEMKKMKRKVSELNSHYIICGSGRVGTAAARHFQKKEADFVIIESSEEHCEEIASYGYLYIHGDATQEESMKEAGIKSAKGLIALLNKDPDNLFIVLTARELNPTLHIIARAEDRSSEHKILRAGADNVISPFHSAGIKIADDLLIATGSKPDQSTKSTLWITVKDGSSMVNETIEELSVEMGVLILGLRRGTKDSIFPDEKAVVNAGDQLLVVEDDSNAAAEEKEHSGPLEGKVVIVDDNPVILRLYSRLFQKAGFVPLTAQDGRTGRDLIIKEKPAVAIIDYALPILNGLDICQSIRRHPEMNRVKLLLFTADETPEMAQRAKDAGADRLIRKGPEASEIIQAVQHAMVEDSP
ncbi:MAG: NAD-binding protein [Thermodesulfobacteriota bacterium]